VFAIECRNLSKRYGQHQAVDDLSLTVEPAQVYGFLGPNGAGKTTTIRMMLDLITPTEGEVRVLGHPVRRNPSALAPVGAFIEGASFYPYLSAWENLQVFGRTSGKFDPVRALMLLEAIDLVDRKDDRVGGYSTGMKQRLGIAAALLHDPQVVILDEPTSGLDPAGIREMRGFIRNLVTEQGKTVFLSSHQLSEVQQVCDRVAIIQKGRLLAEGRVTDLLNQSGKSVLKVEVVPLDRAKEMLFGQWDVAIEDNWLVITAERNDIPQIIRQLAELDIYDMQHQQTNLEDFFLSVTGESADVVSG
jgi:ABC-2 type transport system ATP-binding protein